MENSEKSKEASTSSPALAQKQRVIVYVTTNCPHCVRVKTLLKKRGIVYDEVDVTSNDEKRTWLVKTTKQRTVPQVFIGTESVGGADDVQDLDKKGELLKKVCS